jgi:hypothetical protein
MQQPRDAGSARRAAPLGARPPGWLTQAPFAVEVGRIADALSRMRLRLSIYVLRFDGLPATRAHALAEDALRQEGMVGRLPEGRIGLLRVADEAPAPEALRSRLGRRLAAQLWRDGGPEAPVTLHVAERHGWTDEFERAAEAIEDLMDEPSVALPLERPWRG